MRSGRVRGVGVLGGLLLWLAPALAAQAGRISYEAFTLPNGVHVLYSEDHSAPIVSVDVLYKDGARKEQPDRSGSGHLFEHMMFVASADARKGQHFQLTSRAGGTSNVSTAGDRT